MINLDNAEHLRDSELIGALLALSSKRRSKEFDWNKNLFVGKAIDEVKQRLPRFNSKLTL